MLPLVGLVLFVVLLVLGVRRWRGQSHPSTVDVPGSDEDAERVDGAPGPAVARGPATRGTQRMRRRPGATAAAAAAASTSGEGSGEAEEEEEQGQGDGGYYVAKNARKKDAKKQENAARRQAEALARESRQEKADHYAEMRRKKDLEREAEEQRKEEAARLQKEKEEAAANEEFEKWKGAFSVENEGTLAAEEAETQSLLNDFVEFIKEQKCVGIEDLAGEFKMKSQDCINRIQELEQIGRLSGVMDDRGKFIYISPEEMQAVADYIKRTGRVSIAHLARKSNEFIDLQPKVPTAPAADTETRELETVVNSPVF